MADGLLIDVDVNNDSAYRKLQQLRESIILVRKEFAKELRIPAAKGGLDEAEFKKKFGYARNEFGKFYQELNNLDQQYANRQSSSAVNSLVNSTVSQMNRMEKQVQSTGSIISKVSEKDLAMPSLRYALYDIANSAGQIEMQLQNAGAALIKFASDYESASTNIARTTLASPQQLQQINTELLRLSETIPVSFVNLTDIATLGAQLGLSAGELSGFSETVAQFSAATNVSTESAAQAFGALKELLNISAGEFQNLGSAIAYVGVKSVATESQIISVAESIGGVANGAGLSADYVIGLAGAMASLKIPSEQARGALTRIFQEVNRSASGAVEDMQGFASVLGMSAEDTQKLAQTDMQQFFNKFIAGLSSIDSTQLTNVLDQLSLSDIRVTNVLTRLSRNTDLVSESLNNSNQAFTNGAFLGEVYSLRVDDLASKLQILQNSLSNLGANAGSAFEPLIKSLVDGITSIVQGLNAALSTGAGKIFVVVAGGAGILAASIAGLIQLLAGFVASLGAVRFALNTLGWDSASKGFAGLAASIFGAKAATDATSVSMGRFKLALASTGIGLAVVLLGTLATAFMESAQSADNAFNQYVGSTAGLTEAIAADRNKLNEEFRAGNYAAADSYALVNAAIDNNNSKQDEALKKYQVTANFLGSELPDALTSANDAIGQNTAVIGANTVQWLKNQLVQQQGFQELIANGDFVTTWSEIGADFDKATKIAAQSGEQGVRDYFYGLALAAVQTGPLARDVIRRQNEEIARGLAATPLSTLQKQVAGDYANSAAFQKFSQILGGFGNKVRFLTGSINEQGASAKGAAGENSDYGNSLTNVGSSAGSAAEKIRTLTDYASDLSTIWERARDIRFSGTETLDKITSSFQKIAKATEDARQQIAELNVDIQALQADQALQQYFLQVAEAYGDALKAQEIRANLAKIDADLTKKTKDLQKAQDKTNKTLVGNSEAAIDNRSEILDLVKSYQDHVKALAASGMKQDELRVKTEQLKQDFLAQATQLGYNSQELSIYAAAFDDVRVAIDTVPRDITVDFNGDPALTAAQEFMSKLKSTVGGGVSVPVNVTSSGERDALQRQLDAYDAMLDAAYAASGGNSNLNTSRLERAMRTLRERIANFATGGYVSGPGSATSDSIPANLSNGEYVIRAAAVQRYGTSFFDNLNQMRSPQYYSGGAVGSTPAMTMVALSPEDRALLRNVGGSGEVVLYANNEAIARSANAGNKAIVAAGGRP